MRAARTRAAACASMVCTSAQLHAAHGDAAMQCAGGAPAQRAAPARVLRLLLVSGAVGRSCTTQRRRERRGARKLRMRLPPAAALPPALLVFCCLSFVARARAAVRQPAAHRRSTLPSCARVFACAWPSPCTVSKWRSAALAFCTSPQQPSLTVTEAPAFRRWPRRPERCR
jgi:hypothetical protein